MKKTIWALGLAALISFSIQPASAGIMVEPFLGYEFGDADDSTETNKDKISGVHLGARLGYSILGLSFGAEYSKATLDYKDKNGNPDADFDTTDMGLFVGYNFPIMFRAYASYFLSSEGKYKVGGASATVKGDGGMRLGVGLTTFPFVNVNLEYITRNYDKMGSTTIDFKTNSYMLSVSLPLP